MEIENTTHATRSRSPYVRVAATRIVALLTSVVAHQTPPKSDIMENERGELVDL
jgi:hypothetical protein